MECQHDSLPDAFILLQHKPVYTLGRGSTLANLKFDPENTSHELYRTERGGEVTYHGPGQVVGYPILNLRHHKKDLHWYLRMVEEVVIKVLRHYGLQGYRVDKMTGVWVEGKKIAAIGMSVSKWVTMHGFSINVNPDLKAFDEIIACGLIGKDVCSLSCFVEDVNIEEVKDLTKSITAETFGLEFVSKEAP